ncbi:WD repeat-containing protein 63 [Eurytemora carolleeae]|uniref:WD repeat-containing protein 63 n=1 Tax=Eurytemora carolleeae TaxID=1294199 RepID=UPI000C781E99|nr:WD repeat-containing protein 63 [Eurytemora carolleeae]|eukprot:XP_023349661.1 WD repeat-containing protein 63-like [Eurytemora affinis]
MSDLETEDLDSSINNGIVEGAYPVKLSRKTQENIECVVNIDISTQQPLKFVSVETILEDYDHFKENSDFSSVIQVIKTCNLTDVLLVLNRIPGNINNFLLCATQDAIQEYLRREEDSESGLLDLVSEYTYKPPSPNPWQGLGSDKEIENDWVKDCRPRIHLNIKLALRKPDFKFSDRGVEDVKDGYVSCEPFQDATKWSEVRSMERGMQAVPILMENGTQTHLTHPKSVYIQYESRSFSDDEMRKAMSSDKFKSFITKAENLIEMAQSEGDIMGNIREDVEQFYLRDHVEEKIETQMIEFLSLSDLVFSRNKRVKAVEWHKHFNHITAMACVDNLSYDDHIESLSKRLLSPNYILIWSTKHFIYPQLLLRAPDDVVLLRWHPTESASLIGGLINGQLVIWDLQNYIKMLENLECTWDHRKMNNGDVFTEWNEDKGFIPVLHWSAQSAIDQGHLEEVMDIQWVPNSIRYDQESSFPKESSGMGNYPQQLMSCARENYILVWQIDIKPVESAETSFNSSTLNRSVKDRRESFKSESSKYKQVIGRYTHLELKWKPIYKLGFLKPDSVEERFHPMCLQAFAILDRPEHVDLHSLQPGGSVASSRRSSVSNASSKDEKVSNSSMEHHKNKDKSSNQPLITAVPTFLLAGTLQGAVFRANVSVNKINSETGELTVNMQWYKVVHDGPVNAVSRSPHYSDLILTVGGNLLIIWRETELNQPLIVKSSDQFGLTKGCWSLSRPSLVYTSCEDGTIQCWSMLAGGNSPIHEQNISGYTITCITGYEVVEDENQYLSTADTTGSVRLLKLPPNLQDIGLTEREDTEEFTQRETERLKFMEERAGSEEKKEKIIIKEKEKKEEASL